MNQYWVYIITNRLRTLYTGVTNNLERRVSEHKQKIVPGFTSKYNITSLVYCEVMSDAKGAIFREKQIKGWRRARKVALVESVNPSWRDLSEDWGMISFEQNLIEQDCHPQCNNIYQTCHPEQSEGSSS